MPTRPNLTVPSPGPSTAPPAGFLPFLLVTTVLCGAVVMTIEVLGSRVIGPFFGVSLFVWTSLITVTLIALAAGYAVGGVLADRSPGAESLFRIIFLAGLAVLAVPFVKGPVLGACVSLGLRVGALTSALVLFGPSLFLLGCVSPFVVRIGARELDSLGRTVGTFSALSTAGSFLGTVLTGFVLVVHFGVSRVLFGSGTVLVLLAAAYALFFRRKRTALAALLLPALLLRPEPLVTKRGPDGTLITEVFRKDSHYGLLKVVDYSYGERHNRELLIDGMPQGGVDVRTGESVYEYSYFLTMLPWERNQGGRSCLTIGLGAGVVPAWFESHGVRCDVIEISPEVAAIARDHFGLRISGEVYLGDARAQLAALGKTYDFVILDVFAGESTPGHVLTFEALTLIRSRLSPRGIVGINLIGSLTREARMTASVVKTLESIFTAVEVHPLFDPDVSPGYGNVIILAHDGAPVASDLALLARFPIHPLAKETVQRFLPVVFRFGRHADTFTLTDDYNPIDFYDAWIKEEIRRGILATTDRDILL